jgi:hypothetical protein
VQRGRTRPPRYSPSHQPVVHVGPRPPRLAAPTGAPSRPSGPASRRPSRSPPTGSRTRPRDREPSARRVRAPRRGTCPCLA